MFARQRGVNLGRGRTNPVMVIDDDDNEDGGEGATDVRVSKKGCYVYVRYLEYVNYSFAVLCAFFFLWDIFCSTKCIQFVDFLMAIMPKAGRRTANMYVSVQ